MKTLSFLFVLVSYVNCVQFEDVSVNVEQAKQSGFFPSSEEAPGYVTPQQQLFYNDPPNENRKQLNFNIPPNRYAPPAGNQYYQANPYRPPAPHVNSPVNVNVIRKRPANRPYQHVGQPSNYYNSYPSDLSNPFYQNYANHYQYPTATSPYPDYYNPTRFQSPASSNAQQQILHQPTHQYPNYYTNNYANQFGYQRPTSTYGNSGVGGGSTGGIANFFNNLRESSGSLGQLSQAGTQFSKALEDISENDDLQCVPKILCQMVGSQRPSRLPAIMNAPGISAIISALPSTSPLMNFGRAALLGLSGRGDCDSAYPKCPRDEEQMLLYLNNHRGGFFRFFNGGNSFGDDIDVQQYAQQQETQQQYNQQPAAAEQGLNLLALQTLAETLNSQSSGINLSNLFSSPSNQRPVVQNYPQPLQPTQSSGLFGMFKGNMLTDIVSNLLTGVVGNRFSRRVSKRSIPDEGTSEGQHKIEKRIVNLKANVIEAESNFFEGSSNEQHQNTLLGLEEPFTFSNGNRINLVQDAPAHLSLKFPANQVAPQEVPLSEINQGNFISPSDIARRLKSLFPEATAHLRFDNDQFNRELLKALVNDRIAKILTGVQQQQRPINNNYDVTRYQGSYNSNFNYPAQKPSYAGAGSTNYNNFNTNHINRGQQSSGSGDRSHIVYITNSRGQIEYTLDEKTGQKQRY